MVGVDVGSDLTCEVHAAAPLRADVRYALATAGDDDALRRLLRENPMRGAISVTFEREPHYFAGANLAGSEDHTIVAREGGRLVCMGRCATRQRFVNGRIRPVGYLGELRLDARAEGRFDILRGGYQFFRELQRRNPADFFFTSIATDNDRARRVLERGVRGLPRYSHLVDFVTLFIPVGRVRARARPDSVTPGDAATFLNARAAHHQLAAAWTVDDLAAVDDWLAVADAGHDLVAVAALWDQRRWRQTVVRGYARSLAMMRPVINQAARLVGGPRLPRVGDVVPAAYLSPLATRPGADDAVVELVRAAFRSARERGIEMLIVGFSAGDPRLECVRRHFRARAYRSRLYRVAWRDEPTEGPGLEFDDRLILPEVALL